MGGLGRVAEATGFHPVQAGSIPAGRSITIIIPGLPKGKARPRFTRAGIAYTPAETRSYEGAIKHLAAQEMRGAAPLEGPLQLAMRAIMPVPASWSKKRQTAALVGDVRPTGRPDLDNYLKALLDGCQHIVFRDDAQVWRIEAEKVYGLSPRIIATFTGAPHA